MLHGEFYCFIVTAAAAVEHRVHEIWVIVDRKQVILVTAFPLSISESVLFSYFVCNTNFKESIAGTLCYFPLPLLLDHASKSRWYKNMGHSSHVIWSWQTTRYIHKSFKWLRKAHLKLSTDILITAVQQHKAIHAIWLTYHCLKTIKTTDSRMLRYNKCQV